jgi:hypothetical protein
MKELRELQLAPGETVFLDRIEEGVATLLIGADGGREETVAAGCLPPDARDGQRLRVREDGSLAVDHEATASDRRAVEELMAELLGEQPEGE